MNTKPLPFADGAPLLIANGYQPLAVELSEIALGRTQPPGPFVYGMNLDAIRNTEHYSVGVLPARLPHGSTGTEVRHTWCAGIRIRVAADVTVADGLEEIVRKIAGAGPVQLSHASPSRLIPFRIEGEDARHFTGQTQNYGFDGDPEFHSFNYVALEAVAACWMMRTADLHWRDGLDLTKVSRAELPLLTVDQAKEILEASKEFMASKQPAPEPTKFDRIRARALDHAAKCPGCVRCAGIVAGDLVRVTGLGWPATRVLSVDMDSGQYLITGPEGKRYTATLDRLTRVSLAEVAQV